jgi:ABC-2 type transport system ATP-binding protein
MLTIRSLSKRYGDVVALDGASFEVRPGRIVGFLGPNGAGKTTAMRCIFGLANPDAGEISWKGHPVGHHDRLRFGYMPEERGLYPRMRVGEQLTYFGFLSGMSRSQAQQATDHWLGTLGLSDRTGSRLEELSHGNQQRVQLATALVHEPELLVLDEPFSGLDPLGIEAMSALLVEESQRGVAILFSSHQLDLVEDICEDVVIIDHGKVVLDGEVDRLRAETDKIRVEVAVDDEAWNPSFDGLIEIERDHRHASFLADKDVRIEEILGKAATEGNVTSMSYGPPHLSDLFREAVAR